MRDEAQLMADHFRIRQVLERYCRGIDRLDAALIDSVYWPEATDDHGVYSGPGRDFSAFIIPMLRDGFDATMHVLGQSNIRVEGVRAAADTYFQAYHRRAAYGGIAIDIAAGRYADVFEKRGDEWRISDRVVVMDWTDTRQGLEGAAFGLDIFTTGRRDRDDPSYRAYRDALGRDF